jgi:hypothetical protein
MFPGAQEFKNKVLWIHKPGGADVEFTVLRPVIYLRPANSEQPVEWRIQFTIPKVDEEKFQQFLASNDHKFRFVFESPWAQYEGEGVVKSGPKPYVAFPFDDGKLTRLADIPESTRLERAGSRGR